ncbi:hypothetical protein OPV22_027595 [Ensete ventricosum]|uniref:Protein kinase domain-containing protein n=1 Tax=Ensete ventricosum TaxID=4639 RepID=A0AAV8Q449_ENSVE|nr:hypothetical protein OPV22_027595 [Ensete ventricosum]
MSEALVRDYEIGAEIGRGRFGVVRRCLSAVTGEEFALKSIEKRLLADDVDRECAEREVKIHYLAAAGNPHAVQIHAAFEDDKWVHLVLELLDGPDLCDRIAARKGTPFAEPEAAAVVAALAEAVAACHRRGGGAPGREAGQRALRCEGAAQAGRLRVGGVLRGR